jgi:putative ABC transport system permease protein
MIKNFFTVAIRNFFRQGLYSFINVFGLASGLTCALFIYLWVNDEVSKDHFHNESEKIYQVVSNLTLNDGQILTWTITPGPLAEEIRDNSPEVELVVRTMTTGSLLFASEGKSFMESGYYADPEFFKLFSFEIKSGTPNTDTANISSISISDKLAHKLFGDEDPIGKMVKVNNQTDYSIAAVFEDIGTESSLKCEFILPFEIYKKNRGNGFNWGNYDHPLYVKLTDASKAENFINGVNERRQKAGGKDGGDGRFYAQKFTDVYLHSQYENGKPVGGKIKYVQIFTVVAIFIVLIACINFMNMATAKAASRAKEVGVRKVVGAQRKSLIWQFIAESTLISFMAMLIAVAIVYLMLPMFNSLVNKEIVLHLFEPGFLMITLSIVVITGFLAGSYPAFFLSSYKPAVVLKGSSSQQVGGATLRKGLVVFQFSLTVILIASSLVVYNQIEFIRNKNIGYDRESVLNFSARGNLFREFAAFKNDALQFPAIKQISKANSSLVQVQNQNSSVSWPGKTDNQQVFFRTVVVDYDFVETMGLNVIEGRSFKKDYQDTASFIVSKRAVEVMGLTDPIGTTINQWGNSGTIVGVIDDFHSRSMHEAIDPIVLMCRPDWTGWVFIRFDATKTQEAVAYLEKIHKQYNPDYPFNYSFVDEDFEKLYNNEKVTGSLALGFTVMAIIISGLGLLGLAAYTAERKRKEISVRKTLGASVISIVSMMSKDFLVLSFIAAVIGCPVAYYLMEIFLEGYAYHFDLGWELFVTTAAAVFVLSLLTVIFQVTKAAIANPVDALRNE